MRFLGPEWLAAVAEAAEGAELDACTRLTVTQVVTDGPDGEVAYTLRLADGGVAVHPGRAEDADVTFTSPYPAAVAMARGEVGAQDAFMAGRFRVGGDLAALLAANDALQRLGDVFAAVRDETEY